MSFDIELGASRELKHDDLAKPAEDAARFLIGCQLFTNICGKRTGGIIIETEAYDQTDPFSHCYAENGCNPKKTAEPMRFDAGNVYLYYAAPICFNITSAGKDFGSAVLIRALHPTCGVDEMFARRKRYYHDEKKLEQYVPKYLDGSARNNFLCNGPSNLGVSLGIDDKFYKSDECYSKGSRPLSTLRKPFELWTPKAQRKFARSARKGLKQQRHRWPKEDPRAAPEKKSEIDGWMMREWRFTLANLPEHLTK